MLNLALRQITAWLCLAVAVVTGVAPAQGFMLCVEPDGCVSVELGAATEHCGGCRVHAIDGVSSLSEAPTTLDTSCPCIDFAVPGSPRVQALHPKGADAPLLKWFAMLPTSLAPPLAMAASSFRARPIELPRPPDTLILIRSVVLLT